MDNALYTTLARQSGLMAEMRTVANNIANAQTAGFRREGVGFAEYVARLDGGEPSLSMATPMVRRIDATQGPLTQTGGTLDMAIEGDGFFAVETPEGPRLTRAGAFATNAEGELVTADGYRVLDEGQSPVFVPPGAADLAVGRDGTLSAGGQPLGRIGLFRPTEPDGMLRSGGGLFAAGAGIEPAEGGAILQGFTEGSNVDPMREIARMMEVQHAYEAGQRFLDSENERIRSVISTLGQ